MNKNIKNACDTNIADIEKNILVVAHNLNKASEELKHIAVNVGKTSSELVSNEDDEMWRKIAEEYIPDDETKVVFTEEYGIKIITIVESWNDKYAANVHVYVGKTWLDAFKNSGFLGGLMDQDEEYFTEWFSPDLTPEEKEKFNKIRKEYIDGQN